LEGGGGGRGGCVTVSVRPPIVNVPTRSTEPELRDAAKVTVPFPVPFEPPLFVSHETLLAAVQLQFDPVVTVVVKVSPVAARVRDAGETLYVHEAGAPPSWVTVTVRPATVRVPVRSPGAVLAVTPNVTVPLPVPLEPPLIVSQDALLVAVHPHPPPVVTVVVDEPGQESSDRAVGDTP
jgi:hypothetical protein